MIFTELANKKKNLKAKGTFSANEPHFGGVG